MHVELDLLLNSLPSICLTRLDEPYWAISPSGKFTVTSAYEMLRGVLPLNEGVNSGVVLVRLSSDGEEVLIGLCSPPEGWITLNFDGAYRRFIGQVIASGVLRDLYDEWCGGYATCFGVYTAYQAELWGVYKGLPLA
ncbi:Uncharacterized protein TCM_024533 [Theobroma cacao]|uniref:RNase H type-1 domain-containing protein n=1 Tax=Theobroma cacao TaxID=3641 RepID=A0A061F3Q0_THECC|nr:Uncharacterized protein TCM_024533 [Theobroma cacao]